MPPHRLSRRGPAGRQGTVERSCGCAAGRVRGDGGASGAMARRLRGAPGVESVAVFGRTLRVVGTRSRGAAKTAVAGACRHAGLRLARRSRRGLEDVFIDLMDDGQETMRCRPCPRKALFFRPAAGAVLRKELTQMRRDRATVAADRRAAADPAIPVRLRDERRSAAPADRRADGGPSGYTRTLEAALVNTGYFDLRTYATDGEAEMRRWRGATCCSCSTSRRISRATWIAASTRRS